MQTTLGMNPLEGDKFENEINILCHLRPPTSSEAHANIMHILAYQTSMDPVFYIVDSLGCSTTLKTFLIYKRQVKPALHLLTLIEDGVLPVIAAVKYCHARRVLLRNIIPEAFLCEDNGNRFTVKLFDLHLARHIEGQENTPLSYPGDQISLSLYCFMLEVLIYNNIYSFILSHKKLKIYYTYRNAIEGS